MGVRIPFNVLTGTILPISIGVGVVYSVHITNRFIDEHNAIADVHRSLLITLRRYRRRAHSEHADDVRGRGLARARDHARFWASSAC